MGPVRLSECLLYVKEFVPFFSLSISTHFVMMLVHYSCVYPVSRVKHSACLDKAHRCEWCQSVCHFKKLEFLLVLTVF